ncbi:class I SAM-dependent methyltransferase [Flavobacterium sp. H122]|uniref:class I SAM-dependent methyltransferase n=1 Tax=Flavobacterium sp. H122 TaxID=2529860 RepID=UPI0010AA6C9A|nr:class I SAM-dependent methyltransferase [Flavobacterium sp. H122]
MTPTELRESIFRHLDGIVIVPIASILKEKGITSYLLEVHKTNLKELTDKFNANEGYLNVAIRALASQGFLEYEVVNQKNEISIAINDKSEIAFSQFYLYDDVVKTLSLTDAFTANVINSHSISILNPLFEKYKNRFGLQPDTTTVLGQIQHQILKHIEGILVSPLIVNLGMTGMFHKYFMETSFSADEFHKEPEAFTVMLDFFTNLGWFTEKKGKYQFTEAGLFFAKRASAYGVTVSYLPMLKNIETLLFGNPNKLRDIAVNETEIHVNREMNVWGSGGAHSTYFKVIDEIIIELFNRPIAEQPKGILDMGCGNGAFLQHIFNVIERQTLRGKMLEEYPLFLVGADYNQVALKVTRANLIKADIWAKVIWGDIGNPDLLAEDLQENYGIDLKDLLNVRTFLDHNRIWTEPKSMHNITSNSTGAFAYRGELLSNNAVEANLFEHLEKWSKYVHKFGLLLIELHTVNSKIVAQNIGKTPATAYDVTHGLSDQYIVEIEEFVKVAEKAGLVSDSRFFQRFPNTDYATVSIHLLKG